MGPATAGVVRARVRRETVVVLSTCGSVRDGAVRLEFFLDHSLNPCPPRRDDFSCCARREALGGAVLKLVPSLVFRNLGSTEACWEPGWRALVLRDFSDCLIRMAAALETLSSSHIDLAGDRASSLVPSLPFDPVGSLVRLLGAIRGGWAIFSSELT